MSGSAFCSVFGPADWRWACSFLSQKVFAMKDEEVRARVEKELERPQGVTQPYHNDVIINRADLRHLLTRPTTIDVEAVREALQRIISGGRSAGHPCYKSNLSMARTAKDALALLTPQSQPAIRTTKDAVAEERERCFRRAWTAEPLPEQPVAPEHMNAWLYGRDCAAAAIRDERSPPTDGEGWREIASAPKDGSEFLAWWPFQFRGEIYLTSWEEDKYGKPPRPYWKPGADERIIGKLAARANQPTHWLPLPAPPTTEAR